MTTLAKIEANQRNATLSTGPRTAEGKAVARNAVRHGIFAAVPVVPGECPDAWEAHRAGVVESLAPAGFLELNLAERAALLLWRLQRLARYEAETVAAAVEDADVPPLPDPEPLFGRAAPAKTVTRADQLRDLRRELRSARADLASVVPVRDCARELPGMSGAEAILAPTAGGIFGAALAHALTVAHRREDPPRFDAKAFRRHLGLPDAPHPADWTADRVRRGLALYAATAGESPARTLAAVRDALEDRAEDLDRAVRRLEGEAAAVARILETGPEREKTGPLLPGGGRDERIAKYERHLHTLLTSTLHELERLQARRGGEPVQLPAVAEVNVTIESDGG